MKAKNIHKILIANRSEIASRIIKAIHKTGKTAVVIYADSDKNMPFVSNADEAWSIGDGNIGQTYLNQKKIIDIAKKAKADAIHPGYGFLSENADFAALCKKNGIIFIGPDPDVIDMMGNKAKARKTAQNLGIPVITGMTGTVDEILTNAVALIFPVLIKPAAGGGGKGMQIVHNRDLLKESLDNAAREARNYFGSEELYLEHYIKNARHIEVQVLGDHHGKLIHLFERECSLQRRYQKIIEEAPSTSISDKTRGKITSSALALAKGINYKNAGTVEFLVDEDENFYFIEMNTRIQVEHPVTEQITGVDIVSEQIRIAENKPLRLDQKDIKINGHSIEARLYAENPEMDFMPSTGKILKSNFSRITVRNDHGYESGNIVTPYYDPMLAKVVAHGSDREEATDLLINALEDYHISGIKTNKTFLIKLLKLKDFVENKIYTKYIDEKTDRIFSEVPVPKEEKVPEIIISLISTIVLCHEYNPEALKSIWHETGHWRLVPEIKLFLRGDTYSIKYELIERKKKFLLFFNGFEKNVELLSQDNGHYKIIVDEQQFNCWASINCSEVWFDYQSESEFIRRLDIPDERYAREMSAGDDNNISNDIIAPLNGKIVKVNAKENFKVKKGEILVVIESMKMENKITSPRDAEIESVHVKPDDLIEQNNLLIKLKQ